MSSDVSGTHGNLCRACGFCCDGTLFGRGSLEPDEVEPARARGLRILDSGDCFAQPCAGHDGDRCTIYAHRPACCRDYRCAMLERVERGDATMSEAVAYVARVRELESVVRAAAPQDRRDDPLFAVARDLVEEATHAEWRRAHAELLLDVAELVLLARRHFGARDDGTLSG